MDQVVDSESAQLEGCSPILLGPQWANAEQTDGQYHTPWIWRPECRGSLRTNFANLTRSHDLHWAEPQSRRST